MGITNIRHCYLNTWHVFDVILPNCRNCVGPQPPAPSTVNLHSDLRLVPSHLRAILPRMYVHSRDVTQTPKTILTLLLIVNWDSFKKNVSHSYFTLQTTVVIVYTTYFNTKNTVKCDSRLTYVFHITLNKPRWFRKVFIMEGQCLLCGRSVIFKYYACFKRYGIRKRTWYNERWRSVVGVGTRLPAGRSGVRIPERIKIFSLF
jgi:hypothetical protein